MTPDEGRPPAAGDRSTDEPKPPSSRPDHAAIERLVEGLLPALAARLGLGDLDEIEVREGGWRVRLRRPAAVAPQSAPEPTGGPERRGASPGAATLGPTGRGSATPLPSSGRGSPTGRGPAGPASRSSPSSLVGIGPAAGSPAVERGSPRGRPRRPVTSPAVGIFRPAAGFAVGRRIRGGDRIGLVDVLGVPHDVVAPADGLVAEVVAEAGQPVEYGQELGFLEPLGPETLGAPPSRAQRPGDAPSTPDTAGTSGGS